MLLKRLICPLAEKYSAWAIPPDKHDGTFLDNVFQLFLQLSVLIIDVADNSMLKRAVKESTWIISSEQKHTFLDVSGIAKMKWR